MGKVDQWGLRNHLSFPITFPREGGCVYFRKAHVFGILSRNGFLVPARAGGGGRQTQGKDCRHGKTDDDRGQEANRLPPPAGLDSGPDSKGPGTQQVHHHPRDSQPLGRVRQGLQMLKPHLRALRLVHARQGLRRRPQQALPLHGRVLRGLPRFRGADMRPARDAVARLQRVRGLQVMPHDEAPLRRGRGAGEPREPPARLPVRRPPGRRGRRAHERRALALHHEGTVRQERDRQQPGGVRRREGAHRVRLHRRRPLRREARGPAGPSRRATRSAASGGTTRCSWSSAA